MRAAVVLASLAFVFGCTVPPPEGSEPRAAPVPVFEVDASWPKVPDKWRLGDASSIGIDADDNVYVLHRPRTLKPGEPAAPAILVFDAAGNFLRAWGGAGAGF